MNLKLNFIDKPSKKELFIAILFVAALLVLGFFVINQTFFQPIDSKFLIEFGNIKADKHVKIDSQKHIETIILNSPTNNPLEYSLITFIPKELASSVEEVEITSNATLTILESDPLIMFKPKIDPGSIAAKLEFSNADQDITTMNVILPTDFILNLSTEEKILLTTEISNYGQLMLSAKESNIVENNLNSKLSEAFFSAEEALQSQEFPDAIYFGPLYPPFSKVLNIIQSALQENLIRQNAPLPLIDEPLPKFSKEAEQFSIELFELIFEGKTPPIRETLQENINLHLPEKISLHISNKIPEDIYQSAFIYEITDPAYADEIFTEPPELSLSGYASDILYTTINGSQEPFKLWVASSLPNLSDSLHFNGFGFIETQKYLTSENIFLEIARFDLSKGEIDYALDYKALQLSIEQGEDNAIIFSKLLVNPSLLADKGNPETTGLLNKCKVLTVEGETDNGEKTREETDFAKDKEISLAFNEEKNNCFAIVEISAQSTSLLYLLYNLGEGQLSVVKAFKPKVASRESILFNFRALSRASLTEKDNYLNAQLTVNFLGFSRQIPVEISNNPCRQDLPLHLEGTSAGELAVANCYSDEANNYKSKALETFGQGNKAKEKFIQLMTAKPPQNEDYLTTILELSRQNEAYETINSTTDEIQKNQIVEAILKREAIIWELISGQELTSGKNLTNSTGNDNLTNLTGNVCLNDQLINDFKQASNKFVDSKLQEFKTTQDYLSEMFNSPYNKNTIIPQIKHLPQLDVEFPAAKEISAKEAALTFYYANCWSRHYSTLAEAHFKKSEALLNHLALNSDNPEITTKIPSSLAELYNTNKRDFLKQNYAIEASLEDTVTLAYTLGMTSNDYSFARINTPVSKQKAEAIEKSPSFDYSMKKASPAEKDAYNELARNYQQQYEKFTTQTTSAKEAIFASSLQGAAVFDELSNDRAEEIAAAARYFSGLLKLNAELDRLDFAVAEEPFNTELFTEFIDKELERNIYTVEANPNFPEEKKQVAIDNFKALKQLHLELKQYDLLYLNLLEEINTAEQLLADYKGEISHKLDPWKFWYDMYAVGEWLEVKVKHWQEEQGEIERQLASLQERIQKLENYLTELRQIRSLMFDKFPLEKVETLEVTEETLPEKLSSQKELTIQFSEKNLNLQEATQLSIKEILAQANNVPYSSYRNPQLEAMIATMKIVQTGSFPSEEELVKIAYEKAIAFENKNPNGPMFDYAILQLDNFKRQYLSKYNQETFTFEFNYETLKTEHPERIQYYDDMTKRYPFLSSLTAPSSAEKVGEFIRFAADLRYQLAFGAAFEGAAFTFKALRGAELFRWVAQTKTAQYMFLRLNQYKIGFMLLKGSLAESTAVQITKAIAKRLWARYAFIRALGNGSVRLISTPKYLRQVIWNKMNIDYPRIGRTLTLLKTDVKDILKFNQHLGKAGQFYSQIFPGLRSATAESFEAAFERVSREEAEVLLTRLVKEGKPRTTTVGGNKYFIYKLEEDGSTFLAAVDELTNKAITTNTALAGAEAKGVANQVFKINYEITPEAIGEIQNTYSAVAKIASEMRLDKQVADRTLRELLLERHLIASAAKDISKIPTAFTVEETSLEALGKPFKSVQAAYNNLKSKLASGGVTLADNGRRIVSPLQTPLRNPQEVIASSPSMSEVFEAGAVRFSKTPAFQAGGSGVIEAGIAETRGLSRFVTLPDVKGSIDVFGTAENFETAVNNFIRSSPISSHMIDSIPSIEGRHPVYSLMKFRKAGKFLAPYECAMACYGTKDRAVAYRLFYDQLSLQKFLLTEQGIGNPRLAEVFIPDLSSEQLSNLASEIIADAIVDHEVAHAFFHLNTKTDFTNIMIYFMNQFSRVDADTRFGYKLIDIYNTLDPINYLNEMFAYKTEYLVSILRGKPFKRFDELILTDADLAFYRELGLITNEEFTTLFKSSSVTKLHASPESVLREVQKIMKQDLKDVGLSSKYKTILEETSGREAAAVRFSITTAELAEEGGTKVIPRQQIYRGATVAVGATQAKPIQSLTIGKSTVPGSNIIETTGSELRVAIDSGLLSKGRVSSLTINPRVGELSAVETPGLVPLEIVKDQLVGRNAISIPGLNGQRITVRVAQEAELGSDVLVSVRPSEPAGSWRIIVSPKAGKLTITSEKIAGARPLTEIVKPKIPAESTAIKKLRSKFKIAQGKSSSTIAIAEAKPNLTAIATAQDKSLNNLLRSYYLDPKITAMRGDGFRSTIIRQAIEEGEDFAVVSYKLPDLKHWNEEVFGPEKVDTIIGFLAKEVPGEFEKEGVRIYSYEGVKAARPYGGNLEFAAHLEGKITEQELAKISERVMLKVKPRLIDYMNNIKTIKGGSANLTATAVEVPFGVSESSSFAKLSLEEAADNPVLVINTMLEHSRAAMEINRFASGDLSRSLTPFKTEMQAAVTSANFKPGGIATTYEDIEGLWAKLPEHHPNLQGAVVIPEKQELIHLRELTDELYASADKIQGVISTAERKGSLGGSGIEKIARADQQFNESLLKASRRILQDKAGNPYGEQIAEAIVTKYSAEGREFAGFGADASKIAYINDTYGKEIGDYVIHDAIPEAINRVANNYPDLEIKYVITGGDEFFITVAGKGAKNFNQAKFLQEVDEILKRTHAEKSLIPIREIGVKPKPQIINPNTSNWIYQTDEATDIINFITTRPKPVETFIGYDELMQPLTDTGTARTLSDMSVPGFEDMSKQGLRVIRGAADKEAQEVLGLSTGFGYKHALDKHLHQFDGIDHFNSLLRQAYEKPTAMYDFANTRVRITPWDKQGKQFTMLVTRKEALAENLTTFYKVKSQDDLAQIILARARSGELKVYGNLSDEAVRYIDIGLNKALAISKGKQGEVFINAIEFNPADKALISKSGAELLNWVKSNRKKTIDLSKLAG